MQEVRGGHNSATCILDAVLSMCSSQVHHCCLYLLHLNLKAPSALIAP